MLVFVMEIKASIYCFHSKGFLNPFLPHKILLQSSQSSFVVSVLPDLDKRIPIVGSKLFLAIRALCVFLDELHDLGLLNFCALVYQSYKLYFNAHSFAVGFGPNKFGIFYLHFSQAFYLLQQNSQQLCTFSLAINPWWSLVSFAIDAKL